MTGARIDDPIISLPAGATLHPLVLPARADAGAPGPFRDYAEVRNRCLEAASGRDDDSFTPDELLPLLTSDAYTHRRQWRILLGERTIGVAILNLLRDGGGDTAVSAVNQQVAPSDVSYRSANRKGLGTGTVTGAGTPRPPALPMVIPGR